MTRHTIPVGRVLGSPIGLDYSGFLFFFGLIRWTRSVGYFPAEFAGWLSAESWLVGAVPAGLIFVSVLCYELGHSVVALRYQMPVRSITLFIFRGVAQIGGEPPSVIAEYWIAVAGPATSDVLADLFRPLQPLVASAAPLLDLTKYLAYNNGVLAVFTLTTGFPLDGGSSGPVSGGSPTACARPLWWPPRWGGLSDSSRTGVRMRGRGGQKTACLPATEVASGS